MESESAYALGKKSAQHEKTVRTIDLSKLYELFSNLQRGMVNMYRGRGGTYRIAQVMNITDPKEVEEFWDEVSKVRGGLITPLRTLDYSVAELSEPLEETGNDPIPPPATIEEFEAGLGRPATKREKRDFEKQLKEQESEE